MNFGIVLNVIQFTNKMESKYKSNFYRLNKENRNIKDNDDFNFLDLITDNDTLICGKCEKEKHIDYFCESRDNYLCDDCFNSK